MSRLADWKIAVPCTKMRNQGETGSIAREGGKGRIYEIHLRVSECEGL